MTPVTNILHKATNTSGRYNCLTYPTHERWQSGLSNVNTDFYMFQTEGVKPWNKKYGEIPSNHFLMSPKQIYRHIDFDFILSQNKFGQFQISSNFARQLHLPIVSIEHTLPIKAWPKGVIEQRRQMRGDINVFISEYSCKEWGFNLDDEDTEVIHHSIDSELFSPKNEQQEKSHVLSVVNDWINRDVECGFNIWRRVSAGLPVKVLGDTPGLSLPASSINELVSAYSSAAVFLNTSQVSPIPMSLLEAMSCGCAVVSTATCMIPEIIQNGVNGFLSNDEQELRGYVEDLLKDEKLREEVGKKARETVVRDFSPAVFTQKWNNVFQRMGDAYYA